MYINLHSSFPYSVSGTEARIVFVDETGNEKQVMPLAGHFVDKEDSLEFGQGEDRVDIIMSSDACNTAVATPPYAPQDQGDSNQNEDEEGEFEEEEEDTGKDYELDIGLALEAAADASAPGDEQDSGIFKRGLRNGLRDSSLSVVKSSTGASSSGALSLVGPSPSEVLARHRAAFAKAKIASREGRKLQGGSTSFEMCTPGSSCVISFKKVFVTSSSWNGNLNTASGANNKCQNHAASAGLDGTFKAWLSYYSNGDRGPLNSFDHSTDSFPYYLVAAQGGVGARVANNWADLVDGTIQHQVNADQNGNTVADGTTVWTGVTSGGGPQTRHCKDPWSSSKWKYGYLFSQGGFGTIGPLNNGKWTSNGNANCNQSKRLYCFQQDASTAVSCSFSTFTVLFLVVLHSQHNPLPFSPIPTCDKVGQ